MQISLSDGSLKNLTSLGRKFPVAGSWALNRLTRGIKTDVSAIIRGTYNIKKQDLDPKLTLRFSTPRNLIAIIRSRSRRIRLIYFRPRPAPPRRPPVGISVEVKKGHRRTIRGAFIAPFRRGTETLTVFQRIGKDRLPIRSLSGPGVSELFGSKYMEKKIDASIGRRFPVELYRALKHHITSRGGSISE